MRKSDFLAVALRVFRARAKFAKWQIGHLRFALFGGFGHFGPFWAILAVGPKRVNLTILAGHRSHFAAVFWALSFLTESGPIWPKLGPFFRRGRKSCAFLHFLHFLYKKVHQLSPRHFGPFWQNGEAAFQPFLGPFFGGQSGVAVFLLLFFKSEKTHFWGVSLGFWSNFGQNFGQNLANLRERGCFWSLFSFFCNLRERRVFCRVSRFSKFFFIFLLHVPGYSV